MSHTKGFENVLTFNKAKEGTRDMDFFTVKGGFRLRSRIVRNAIYSKGEGVPKGVVCKGTLRKKDIIISGRFSS